jgi:hypothetical protein
MWEGIMGLLSDLFGAGKRRDEAQDARIAALEARPVGAEDVEARGSITALTDALAGMAGRVATLEGRETVDDVARAAAAGAAAATQGLHERLAVIEAEFAALPTPDGGGGGVTVPEIEP